MELTPKIRRKLERLAKKQASELGVTTENLLEQWIAYWLTHDSNGSEINIAKGMN